MNVHEEIGELLKYYELNKQFPPESYASKWDYNTAIHIWVKYNHSVFALKSTESEKIGEE